MFLGTNYFLIWLDAIEMVFLRAEVFIVWFYGMTLGLDYSPQNICIITVPVMHTIYVILCAWSLL